MKRQIAILLLLVAASARAEQRPLTTIILVRHAERASQAADSPLNAAGFTRAKELARVLAGADISAIYATEFVRTQQTIAPLALAHRLKPEIRKTGDRYARDLVTDILAHHAGQTVVVVGHTDTTPNVLRALGITNPPAIAMTEYDDLFICTPPKLLVLRYGVSAR